MSPWYKTLLKDLGFFAFLLAGVYALFFLITAPGCTDAPCKQWDKVSELGQCAYSKIGDWGDSECVALTEGGYKVTSKRPYVKGEQVCVAR